MSTSASAPRWRILVRHDRRELYEKLRDGFAPDGAVGVVLDRRRGSRRGETSVVEEDRRRRDRRQPAPSPDPDLWEAAGFQLTEEGRVMPQWEYKLEELSSREVPRLNRLGREGWEAVAVMPVSGREPVQYVVLFKRPTRG